MDDTEANAGSTGRRRGPAWGLPIAALLVVAAAPAQARTVAECAALLSRLQFYVSATHGLGGHIVSKADPRQPGFPRALFRYDPSRGLIRLITLTPDVIECSRLAGDAALYADFQWGPPPASPLRTSAPAAAAVATPIHGSQVFDVADLDRDGDLDAVTVGTGDDLTVWLGDDSDELTRTTDIAIGTGASQVVLADLNEDGKSDAIVARAGNYGTDPGGVSVLLGRGDATFGAARSFPAGKVPLSLTVADLNGDHHLDVASANADQAASPKNVAVRLGNGAGNLAAPKLVAGIAGTTAILAADFTGDGVADLAVANRDLEIALLRGNGDGTFKAPLRTAVGVPVFFLTAVDFNQDGVLDLTAAATHNGAISFLVGQGDGSFAAPIFVAGGVGAESFAVVDLADDGSAITLVAPDLAQDGLALVPITNDGHILAPGTYPTGASGPNDLAIADFNLDSHTDIAVANFASPGVSLLAGLRGVRFEEKTPLDVSSRDALATGDFDKDGKPDLAALGSSLALLRGNGDFTFKPAVSTSLGSSEHRDLDAADFNNDGLLDLAVASSGPSSGSGQVSVLRGTGGGAFSTTTLSAGNHPVAVLARDVNADTRPDLLVVDHGTFQSDTDPGGIFVFIGNGNGTFRAARRYTAGRNPASIAVGDLNADRLPDIAITTEGPGFAFYYGVLLGSGNGLFGRARLTPTADLPVQIAIGPFTANPAPDLLIAYCCGGTDMAILSGKGNGTFRDEVHFPAGANVQRMALSDFNADGLKDLAVANSVFTLSGGAVTVLLRYAGVATCFGALPTLVGTAAADNISATAADDVVVGLEGNDRIDGGQGNDLICGGAGNDTLLGGTGDDSLRGDAGSDVMNGGQGNDRLNGGSGNDRLSGVSGNDRLEGSTGTDNCQGGADVDSAKDCEVVGDVP